MDASEFNALPDDALVRREAASRLTGSQSPDTLNRWSRAGRFPQPIPLPGMTLYRVGDLRTWLRDPAGYGLIEAPLA